MKLKFEGVHKAYDGEYDFDPNGGFTHREWHIIKQISGVRQGEFDDALEAEDSDLVVAIATIVLKRYGKEVDADTLWDTKSGAITMELDEQDLEDDADPPPPELVTRPSSPPDSSGSTTENGSESPENGRSRTGSPPSDTSATSESATSAT